jgi:hypothetical protein
MGTLTAGSLIDKALIQLNDMTAVRWTRAELLEWANDAQKILSLAAPDTTATIAQVTTIAGVRQSIPADGWILLRANRNMGATGLVSGRVLQLVPIEELTQNNPSWASETPTAIATAYCYSAMLKNTFWIYPPADSSGYKIEVVYSKVPTVMATESALITVLDIYAPALLDYMLYKACLKDAEYAPGQALASGYLASFNTLISVVKTEATK